MTPHFHKRLMLLFALLALLSGCGGGGSPPPTDSKNWDALTWDQDEWA